MQQPPGQDWIFQRKYLKLTCLAPEKLKFSKPLILPSVFINLIAVKCI
ncbi:hypothetical protein Cabys_4179 [Caldithrix abyssi DSM 13497]|uniref:Uncharacterized protein n=1 Tax=Caldithrix abyssi DSM 13497 TaxID=880073 RepID=A0A1J1CEU1_CALAY|nr:hypothetical protein Cabys_4179 [Caldithrix abyssi DSM 13497]